MTTQEHQIGLNDFATTVSIIDICTERGAFKGNELLVVGKLREKFTNFIQANTEQEPVADEPEMVEDTPVGDTEFETDEQYDL